MRSPVDADAVMLVRRGNDARAAGQLSLAEADYQQAAARAPMDFSPWYNLGLLYKQQGRWHNAHDAFYRARARLSPEITVDFYAALCWNLGVSATITQNWPEAHESWRHLGYEVGGDPRLPPVVADLPGLLFLVDDVPVRLFMMDPVRGRDRANRVHVRDAERVSTFDGEAVFPVLHTVE
jgi:hypothetical protein